MAVDTPVSVAHPTIKGLKRLRYSLSADTELVAAVTGKQIHVMGVVMNSIGGTVALESSTTAILGAFTLTAAPMVLPVQAHAWCETVAGEALNIELSATDLNIGTIFYVVDP